MPASQVDQFPSEHASRPTAQPPLISNAAPHGIAATAWQQKVFDVEAKLQGDLQQDLAR